MGFANCLCYFDCHAFNISKFQVLSPNGGNEAWGRRSCVTSYVRSVCLGGIPTFCRTIIMTSFDLCKNALRTLRQTHGDAIYSRCVKELNREKRTVDKPTTYVRISIHDKLMLYAKQSGRCANPKCETEGVISIKEMEADEIVARANGGSNQLSNRQLLCRHCNRSKSSKSQLQLSKEGYGSTLEQLK